MTHAPLFLVLDFFCGAGGTSQGFANARLHGEQLAQVIACVNHDPGAIKSHRMNHPQVKHFREDIRKVDLRKLQQIVAYWKARYPNAYLIIWASLECTNFSWAKGGKPKNADSRTLANELFRYVDGLNPHYLMIENVTEFMAWGPLDATGRPLSKDNGQYWLAWRRQLMERYGYIDAWQQLNSANFGAHTSRNRLFGIFAQPGLPVTFPAATHCKDISSGDLFTALAPWKPVREVLHFQERGQSIFMRKRPISDRTLGRVFKGLERFVAGTRSKREEQFISLYYSNGANYSLRDPLPTITTKDRAALVSVERETTPAFLLNPAWGGHVIDVNRPCPVIVARQDKAPISLVQTEMGLPLHTPHPKDSPMMVKIKTFMAEHGIADISMRMLTVPELLVIQGFPAHYQLTGTLTAQKKYIGNAVVPVVVQAWVEALAMELVTRRAAA